MFWARLGPHQTTPCVMAMTLSWLATSGQTPRSSKTHKQGHGGKTSPMHVAQEEEGMATMAAPDLEGTR